MLLELIMKHSVAIEADLTCWCGKPSESGNDNKGARDNTEPASLELWEPGACLSLGCCYFAALL